VRGDGFEKRSPLVYPKLAIVVMSNLSVLTCLDRVNIEHHRVLRLMQLASPASTIKFIFKLDVSN